MLKLLADRLMKAEVEALCGARYGSRGDERQNSRNGFRYRQWDSVHGAIEIAIPKLRRGAYFPTWLFGPFGRRVLLAFVAEGCVRGVSSRKVHALVRALRVDGVDATETSKLAGALNAVIVAYREGAPPSGEADGP
jgi:transposase-like protein